MKSIIVLIFFFVSVAIHAQHTEGRITFQIEITALDTSLATQQSAEIMQNSSMNLIFKEEKMRIDFILGEAGVNSYIVDGETDSALLLVANPKQRLGFFSTVNNIKERAASKKDSSTVILLNETRKILGYLCKKAILYEGEKQTTYWYTSDIEIDEKISVISNEMIPGFPMAYSTVKGDILMEFEATAIRWNEKAEIEDKWFDLTLPPGFQLAQ